MKIQPKLMKQRKLNGINRLTYNAHGFSLIEVMVALGAILIVATSVLSLFVRSIHTTYDSKYTTMAIYEAESKIEALKGTDFAHTQELYPENVSFPIENESLPDAIWSVTYPDGNDANPLTVKVTVSWSTNGQMESVQMATMMKSPGDNDDDDDD